MLTRRILRGTADERGYTLVEFAVAMGVFLLFISMATPFMFSQLRGALETEERVDLQQSARSALRTMVGELRQAEVLYQTAENPSGKTQLSFGVDWDANGSITGCSPPAGVAPERIIYYIQSGELRSGCKVGGAAAPLAERVKQVSFDFFGSNLALDTELPKDGVVDYEELDLNNNGNLDESELANVTRIVITLVMVDNDDDEQTYSEQAFLRNRVVG